MVLLKNEKKMLPLQKGAKVALFGKATVDYVKGGGGSGDVTVAYTKSLCDGMMEKEEEGKITLCHALIDFYTENVTGQYALGYEPGMTKEPEIPQDLLLKAKKEAEIAVISNKSAHRFTPDVCLQRSSWKFSRPEILILQQKNVP